MYADEEGHAGRSRIRSVRSPGRLARHGAVVVLIDALVLLALEAILPGFEMDGLGSTVATALGVGLVNAFVWPVLSRLTLRLSVLTLGLFGLVLNALVVGLVMVAMPWVTIAGLTEASVISVVLAIFTSLLSSLLAIDEDSTWYLNVVQSQLRRRGDFTATDEPGFLFLEIDGLAHEVLKRALVSGNAPTMAHWVRSGESTLREWETDWSSQTGACQAGILHGNNRDMPAFRWWEKEDGRALVTNHPRDAAEIEQRQSDGRGLLADGGASRANILSGDATYSLLTMSTVLTRRGKIGRDYAAYFARPYGVLKTILHTVLEILSERRSAFNQRISRIEPRIHRSWTYAVMRAWATVIQLDLQVAAVVGDMLAGRPAVYTTFLAYDEVAHHSGIERPETLATLRKVDHQIARIARIAKIAPRPYRLIVLSDHGQSQGATFLQRYDETLEDVVRSGLSGGEVVGPAGRDPDHPGDFEGESNPRAYLSASFEEASHEDGAIGRTARRAARHDQYRDDIGLDPESPGEDRAGSEGGAPTESHPELSVMASGCLGLITFPRHPGRLTREQIDRLHPDLLDRLRGHPGIGFLLVDTEGEGPLVLGADGCRWLEPDRVEGADPLAPYGPNAAAHVLRTHRFSNCPDLMVNSTVWPELDEVAAFEELVGSHGGIGGPQSHPFVLHPVDLEWPRDPVVGSETIHEILTGWMRDEAREPA